MEMFGHVLHFIGMATLAVALIWSFVVIFQENKLLGVLCLFIPMGLPVALILQWPRTWRPLAVWAIGLTLMFCGMSLARPGM